MYKKLKELIKFPTYFTFKIICFNKINTIKKINKKIKDKKIKIKEKKICFSKNKKYFSYSVKIYSKKFKQIEYLYKKIGKIKYVKIIL